MTVLPVIHRELRASARRSFTYYLRTLGAGALLLASLYFGLEQGFESNFGGKLFGYLHFTLFYAFWILVPLLVADCISRERREGTLGLLYMTGLGGADIVLAKSAAHGLRALTLWLAVVPILAIAFLLGGISWQQALLSIATNASAICWALAAGVLGSAWSKTWGRAVLRSAILALLFFLLMAVITGEGLGSMLRSGKNSSFSNFFDIEPTKLDYFFLIGASFITNLSHDFAVLVFRTVSNGQLIWLAAILCIFSLLGLTTAITLAGAKTRRIWREPPPSSQQIWLQQTFCTPIVWIPFFRQWMKRKLETNPIGWLEQRTWSGRLITWGWLAVVISLYSIVLTDGTFFQRTSTPQNVMGWLLVLSMAISTAGSFRRERESGVLELLLVSPIGEETIIYGRLRGLWGQFLPAFGLLLVLWLYLASISMTRGSDGGSIVFYAITFFSFPVIGLYFSLRCRTFIAALLGAITIGFIIPLIVGTVFAFWWTTFVPMAGYGNSIELTGASWFVALVQAGIAAACWKRLHTRLKTRAFSLDRAVP